MGRLEEKTEELQLVRSSPVREGLWLKARWGRLRFLRRFSDCYVEMRNSALLIFKAQDSGRTNDDALSLVEMSTGKHTEMVPLRTSYVVPFEKKLTITVTKPDLSATVDIRFPDEESFDLWLLNMRELAGLRHTTLADFEIERHVGKGVSGRVYLVHDKETKERLALKVVEKEFVYESSESYRHALDERIVLELATNHPFILDMRYAFQNRERLFLVTEFCGGGDLFDYMHSRNRPVEESKARYIAAEILLALEHVHKIGAVYRDLKLENVLLDDEGHIRLADFGLSKLLTSRDSSPEVPIETAEAPKLGRTNTFCGTREYVAPEMVKGSLYGTSVDIWGFGILLYEILCGKTPFFSGQHDKIYERIEKAPVFYPENMSDEVQDLLKGLLERNVRERLGNRDGGIAEIKMHPWFAAVDWDDLYAMRPHSHSISIAQEIKQMNFGQGSSSTLSQGCQKSERQLAKEKAMDTLKKDSADDTQAMGMATPRTARFGDENVAEHEFSGLRTPQVVPVSSVKTKTRLIPGYSFTGRVPDSPRACEYVSTSTPAYNASGLQGPFLNAYCNPGAGYERASVFDLLDTTERSKDGSLSSTPPRSPSASTVGDDDVEGQEDLSTATTPAPPVPLAPVGPPALPGSRHIRRARYIRRTRALGARAERAGEVRGIARRAAAAAQRTMISALRLTSRGSK